MKDLDYAKWFNTNKEFIKSKIDYSRVASCPTTVIIPVAVHYNNNVDLTDPACLLAKAQEQIQVLNDDFAATNADITLYTNLTANCSSNYPASALSTDFCIQFCLASSAHPTCQDLANLVMGHAITVGEYSWPSAPCWAGYMNFFVEDNLAGGLLGQAPLYGGSNPNGNGVQVAAEAFGGAGGPCASGAGIDTYVSYGLGRTGTHEVGHYFGLQHTFAGCGGGGDGMADTPRQDSPNYGCPTVNTTTCSSNAGNSCGEDDFFMNYMDYVNDACMVMFTDDQMQEMYNTAIGGSFESDVVVCGVVPVEMVSFNAQARNSEIHLDWSTASEVNNEGFVVERSLDGKEFQAIGFVDGNGNSFEELNYSFIDSDRLLASLCYYRLKQVDFDGKHEYSETKSVRISQNTLDELKVFPNPSEGIFYLNPGTTSKENISINVFDQSGKSVWTQKLKLNGAFQMLDMSLLSNGVYRVQIQRENSIEWQNIVLLP